MFSLFDCHTQLLQLIFLINALFLTLCHSIPNWNVVVQQTSKTQGVLSRIHKLTSLVHICLQTNILFYFNSVTYYVNTDCVCHVSCRLKVLQSPYLWLLTYTNNMLHRICRYIHGLLSIKFNVLDSNSSLSSSSSSSSSSSYYYYSCVTPLSKKDKPLPKLLSSTYL